MVQPLPRQYYLLNWIIVSSDRTKYLASILNRWRNRWREIASGRDRDRERWGGRRGKSGNCKSEEIEKKSGRVLGRQGETLTRRDPSTEQRPNFMRLLSINSVSIVAPCRLAYRQVRTSTSYCSSFGPPAFNSSLLIIAHIIISIRTSGLGRSTAARRNRRKK